MYDIFIIYIRNNYMAYKEQALEDEELYEEEEVKTFFL